MKKYKIGIIGFFGNGSSIAGGQEAKTCSLTKAMEGVYGKDKVVRIDTRDWKRHPMELLMQCLSAAKVTEHIIFLPAQNSVRVFIPLFSLLRTVFNCSVHYVVIGGWLPKMMQRRKMLARIAQKLDGIYVETQTMKADLDVQQFNNVSILPNFKYITPIGEAELSDSVCRPYRVCTFSRVMKEKGIEDAIEAVLAVNKVYGKDTLLLDIYGKIDLGYVENFNKLLKNQPDCIRYCGTVEPEKSVSAIKGYYALLFPTYYEGEGFAGTLLDAMASGVPVIASDWKYNPELVREGKTGVLFPAQNVKALAEKLCYACEHPEQWNAMRPMCLEEAKKYRPENVIRTIIDRMEA